ncbi:MAG: hypothetical protein ABI910_04195 [Gemmatimonadota bacterium]
MSPTAGPPRGSSPITSLHQLRHRYGAADSAQKKALIAQLERRAIGSAARLRTYHGDLLFLRAFPDDAETQAMVTRALARIAGRVRRLSPAQRRQLDDTGMAGSTTRHAFAYGIAEWLIGTDEDVEIDWARFDGPERLDPLLRLVLTQAESDAFESGEFSTQEWLELAHGNRPRGSLGWLMRRNAAATHERGGEPDPALVRLLYESLEVPLEWRLTSRRSTSANATDAGAIVAREGMRSAPGDPLAWIATPLPGIARLSRGEAASWLDAAKGALAARCREVHAIAYANPDEVYVADLGGGASLCLIGASATDWLTLEANYGYVLFANGVPVGYGGVTALSAQANTGINIFEEFRRAEAAMLFAQTLRAFHTLFGVTRFVVNPYQFGADNDEALSSGAFWFYDRLGFRSSDARARALADRERARLAVSRTHRSSPATLRRLARSDLLLELPGARRTSLFEERWLVTLATAVTTALQAPDIPARLTRRDAMTEAVLEALFPGRKRAADAAFLRGLRRLAPMLALVRVAIDRWPDDDRESLVALIRLNGGRQELGFALASRAHRRLWSALRQFCRQREARQGWRGESAVTLAEQLIAKS